MSSKDSMLVLRSINAFSGNADVQFRFVSLIRHLLVLNPFHKYHSSRTFQKSAQEPISATITKQARGYRPGISIITEVKKSSVSCVVDASLSI